MRNIRDVENLWQKMTDHFDAELDARGLLCPEPLMLVRKAVREMGAGEILHVLATDPSTDRDLHNFCRFMRHEMVDTQQDAELLEFWIRKGQA